MYRDYPVEPRSDETIRKVAKRLRANYATVVDGRVDLVRTMENPEIPTCHGRKELKVEVDSTGVLAGDEGKTVFSPGQVTIVLSPGTRRGLNYGVDRDRNTAAHEIGHAVLHEGPPMHRGAVAESHFRWIPPFRSAEHQAKVFAPAFLIDDDLALAIGDPEEISITFGVSLESAKIYLGELRKPEEKTRIGQKFRQLDAEFTARAQAEKGPQFLSELCPRCGLPKVFPVGEKFMCQSCEGVFDRFQDGDAFDQS
jgi:hypothetical protein